MNLSGKSAASLSSSSNSVVQFLYGKTFERNRVLLKSCFEEKQTVQRVVSGAEEKPSITGRFELDDNNNYCYSGAGLQGATRIQTN